MMRHGENPLAVTKAIKQKIEQLQAGLPPGVRIAPFYDRTRLIHGAIHTLTEILTHEMIIASLAILLILMHFRSALLICMTLPLAGPIKLAGLTREAAGQKVVEALSPYYTKVTATVQVEKYGSNHVILLGNVKNPGIVNFDQTPTLLEVLSKGGTETRPDGNVPEQCVIYRGDLVYWVDLQELLVTGSPLANLRLRRNDVVFVPALSTRTVTVMGQVQHPGQVVLKHDSTLASVLGETGGLSDAAGSNPELEIVHHSKGDRTQYVRFNDLLKPAKALEITPKPGEIIFVPQSGLYRATYVMERLSPMITAGALIGVGLP